MPPQQPQPQHYSTFLNAMDALDEIRKLSEAQQHGTSAEKNAAESKIREYAFALVQAQNQGGLVPGVTAATLPQPVIEQAINLYVQINQETATNTFRNNLDSIAGELPKKTLEGLLDAPEITSHIKKDDQEIVGHYMQYKKLDDFLTHYKKAKHGRSEEEQELIVQATIAGSADAEREKFKNFSSGVQDAAAALTAATFKHGLLTQDRISSYALPGLEKKAKEVKDSYEKIASTKKRDIYSAMQDAVRETKKLSPAEIEQVYNIVYNVERGKPIPRKK